MGLFSSNKKVCPLCGNPTPRLLALKVDAKLIYPRGQSMR